MSNAMLRIEGLMHRAWVMSEMDGEKTALSRVTWQTKATARQECCAFRVNGSLHSARDSNLPFVHRKNKARYRAVV